VEYVREGYFGSRIVALHDMAYMAMINLTLTFFALWRTSIVSRRVVPQ
jgi:ABC-2 type transport system permease protein/capsular polysaccharide transport system permease protein